MKRGNQHSINNHKFNPTSTTENSHKIREIKIYRKSKIHFITTIRKLGQI